MAFLHGHLRFLLKRLVQQAIRNEKPSGIIKTSTVIMKRVSWFCFGSFFCVSVAFLVFQRKDAIDSKEILLATRHVSTEAKRKMPTTHFATESHNEDLESCCFSRWIFAVCLTVYSIFWEVSAAGVRSEALILLFPAKVVGINCAVESFFCIVCRVLGRVPGNAGSEPANGSGQRDCREIWPCNSISILIQRLEPCFTCFGLCFCLAFSVDCSRFLPTTSDFVLEHCSVPKTIA